MVLEDFNGNIEREIICNGSETSTALIMKMDLDINMAMVKI